MNKSTAPTGNEDAERQESPLYRLPIKKKRKYRARITLADVADMASLASMRLSEAESCAVLNIPVRTWRDYRARNRNDEIFQELLAKMRGNRIRGHIKNVEKFSKKDWRASIAILEKCEPSKFASTRHPSPEQPQVTNVINSPVFLMAVAATYGSDEAERLKRLQSSTPLPKAVQDAPEAVNASMEDFVAKLKPASGEIKP